LNLLNLLCCLKLGDIRSSSWLLKCNTAIAKKSVNSLRKQSSCLPLLGFGGGFANIYLTLLTREHLRHGVDNTTKQGLEFVVSYDSRCCCQFLALEGPFVPYIGGQCHVIQREPPLTCMFYSLVLNMYPPPRYLNVLATNSYAAPASRSNPCLVLCGLVLIRNFFFLVMSLSHLQQRHWRQHILIISRQNH
jgi:hypothetical protein